MGKVKWRVHTPNLLKEIGLINKDGFQIMLRPIQIFSSVLSEVAKRASELDDTKLNALMCRLTLYDIANPESKGYNKKLTEKTIKGVDL